MHLQKNREFHTVRGYQMLNAENKLLTSSMEDYLEMIYRTCIEVGYTRINQLSDKLNVRPSSATKVVQKLAELGLVNYQRYGIVRLTKEGEEIGKFLLRRHEIIQEFLKNLGIKETLLKDTELIEHDVSLGTLKSIYAFNLFLFAHPDIKNKYEEFRLNLDKINIDDVLYEI